MNVDRIILQKLIPTGSYSNIKIGVEATLDAHETPEEAFTKAEVLVNHWFAAAYPNVGESVTYAHVPGSNGASYFVDTNEQKAGLVESIESCSDLRVLESYKLLVKHSNIPNVQEVYDKKFAELSK